MDVREILMAAIGLFAVAPVAGGNELSARLQATGEAFRFAINADAHVSRDPPKRPHRYNQRLREFVAEVNAMNPRPAFAIFNGDIYERNGYPETTRKLLEILQNLRTLPIAVTGNHDVRDFDVDRIFRPVQKALNGTTGDTFSFDCGAWHFVVMPTRELLNTPAKEDAFLGWLDRDLKAHRDRHTMAFMHYHVLPVGMSQLEFYTYSIAYKNKLLDALTRYGNVKYVFSGHVHSGILSSVKTAWRYRGTDFVIAPSPVNPRPFGEEDPKFTMDGGYYLVVDVHGKEVRLLGRQIGVDAEHIYPADVRPYDSSIDPRALTTVWELPAQAELTNGSFEEDLRAWRSPYRYLAEREPGYAWRSAGGQHVSGERAAHLFVRENGQGWALGEFTELYQVFRAPATRNPVVSVTYRPESATAGGGYVWLGGFAGPEARCALLFHWGPKMSRKHTLRRVMSYLLTAGDDSRSSIEAMAAQNRALFWKVPSEAERWHRIEINVAEAMARAAGKTGLFESLRIDRFIIGLGVWCSDKPGSASGAWFDDVQVKSGPPTLALSVNATPLDPKQCGLDAILESEESRPAKKAIERRK